MFLSTQLRHVLHEPIVLLAVLKNHWQYVTHVLLASSPLPESLSPLSIFFAHHSPTPGTGPCSSFRDMALAVRQSTCMCICRAATCIQTSPISSRTGLNSCGGATRALSLFHALVD